MIKILPLENKKCDVEPYFFMSIAMTRQQKVVSISMTTKQLESI